MFNFTCGNNELSPEHSKIDTMFSTKKKSRYIAGWEIDYDDPVELAKILLTQGVDKDGFYMFREMQGSTELVITGEQITEVIKHSAAGTELRNINCPLPIHDWRDRSAFYLHKDPEGTHTIGGRKPAQFQLPTCDRLQSPFIYFATIDGSDPMFEWMHIDKLHIAYPIYEGCFEVFLDYSEPNAPVVMNPEIFDYSWIDDNVKGVDRVEYIKQHYKATENFAVKNVEANRDDYLLSGVPLWYQHPHIPTCPRTGKLMSFVTTINSNLYLGLQDSRGIEQLPFGHHLTFGDHGHLYVFYHPESKVLHLNVQF